MIIAGRLMRGVLVEGSRSLKLSQCLTAATTVTGPVNLPTEKISQSAAFHSSPVQFVGGEWRKKNKQPLNPNSYGVMTDGADYSYLDGRPTPPGLGRIRRAKEQLEVAEKIMKLSAEQDEAISYHAQRQKEKQDMRANRIAGKLKPKGRLPPEIPVRR